MNSTSKAKHLKTRFLIALIFTFGVIVTKGADSLTINLNNNSPVQYCNTPVPIADSITINATFQVTGMKISISQGFIPGEDELTYLGSVNSIYGTWYPAQGYLLLQGNSSSTLQNYQDAIRLVKYKNDKSIPTLGDRKISISLINADYLPATGHFYRFISRPGISWSEAKAEASSDSMMYYGLRGYLATVTSQAENDFIRLKTKGVGWIGASDHAIEGDWRWVTGPEGAEDSGQGRLFWRGRRNQYTAGVPGTGPVSGQYINWNTGEPNDCCEDNVPHEEDYAHITFFQGNSADSYKWNDLPDSGGTGDFLAAGYLIEYGGMPGDPNVQLSATLDLLVNTMIFKTGTVSPICAGDTITLNQPDRGAVPGTYIWSPSGSLLNASMANPVASPTIPTTYYVTGTRGICIDSAHYAVSVNPLPIVNLGNDTTICNPASIVLNAGASYSSYKWSPDSESTQSIVVKKNGIYGVIVSDAHGCKATDQINVSFTDNPKIDFSKLDTLICGKKSDLLAISSDKGSFTIQRLSDGFNFSNLNISVPDFGTYQFLIKSTDNFSCYSDSTINLGFHDIPTVSLSIDSTTCYHYNLDASYIGNANSNISKFTWVFGGDTIVSGIGLVNEKIPLGVNQTKRDLVLNVVQYGCSNQYTIPDIRVIPTLSLSVKDSILCMPLGFDFSASNTETGVVYLWDFGDGTSGTGTNLTHQYSQSGWYDIKLTVTTDKLCSNTASVKNMVFAAPIPDIAFSLSPDSCLDPGVNQIYYTGIIGTDADKYYWDLKAFDPSEIVKDPLQTKGPLLFDLKTQPRANLDLKVISAYGCQSVQQRILIKRKPDFSMIADLTAGCIPFKPELSGKVNDNVDQVAFSWDFGDGTSGTGSPVLHTYEISNKKYTINLKGKSSISGCSNLQIFKDTLETYPQPVAKFSMSDSIVYNDKPKVDFINTSSGAVSWTWNFGDGITSVLESPTHDYTVTGGRMVKLTVSNDFNCIDSVSHHILIAFDRIFPPNGFSPNALTAVDRIFLLDAEGIISEGYHFVVLSRWDDVVFEVKDEKKGWDGHMKDGSFAPAGSYLWILNFTDFLGRKHRQTGTVTLIY